METNVFMVISKQIRDCIRCKVTDFFENFLSFQRKSVFLYRLHAGSGSKTAWKDHRKAFLWRCGTPYMEKAYITRFVLDVSKA